MKDLAELGIKGQITWLYYKDLKKAMDFYQDVMGFDLTIDQGWSKIYKVTNDAYIGLVDESHGYHRASTKKPVIICLNVFNCDAWYSHFQEKGIDTIRKPRDSERLKIRAFMLHDPEGYVIEIQESLEGALSI